ncbi:MAG: hypothetical protein WC651_04800 [Candidatus Gracilibacteria bacterium]|jgi:hypothetical protein
MAGNNQEHRYTDQGQEPALTKDIPGALEGKPREGDSFDPRSTNTPGFVSAVESASETFQLRAQTATENTTAGTAQKASKPETTVTPAEAPALSPASTTTATPTSKTQGPLILLSQSPHKLEHRHWLETTIQIALPAVRGAFTKAGIAIPSDSEILQAMIMTNRFTPEQIEELMRTIQVPGLIVLHPEMQSFEDYVRFLNANKKRRGQYDVFTSGSREIAFRKQDKALEDERRGHPAEYKFGIGEMTQEPANRSGKLRDIVRNWETSDLAQKTRTATFREYTVLRAQAPDLLDLSGWTILSEENAPHKIIGDDNLVSGVYGYRSWYVEYGAYFNGYDPKDEDVYRYARVRPVVVG